MKLVKKKPFLAKQDAHSFFAVMVQLTKFQYQKLNNTGAILWSTCSTLILSYGIPPKEIEFNCFIKAKWNCKVFQSFSITEIHSGYIKSSAWLLEQDMLATYWALWKWNELYSLILWRLAYGSGTARWFTVQYSTCDLVMLLLYTSKGSLIRDFQLLPTTSHSILYSSLLLVIHSFYCLRGSAYMAYCLLFSYGPTIPSLSLFLS